MKRLEEPQEMPVNPYKSGELELVYVIFEYKEDTRTRLMDTDIVPHEGYDHYVLSICQLNEEEKGMLLGNLCRYIRKLKTLEDIE